MDWQGQKMVENLMQYLLLGSALVAFLTGYFTSSYSTMTVPNWPCFNRHPFHWLEPVYAGMASSRQVKSKEQAAARKAFVKPQGKR
jgi:signal peptidase complex subunit 1